MSVHRVTSQQMSKACSAEAGMRWAWPAQGKHCSCSAEPALNRSKAALTIGEFYSSTPLLVENGLKAYGRDECWVGWGKITSHWPSTHLV